MSGWNARQTELSRLLFMLDTIAFTITSVSAHKVDLMC